MNRRAMLLVGFAILCPRVIMGHDEIRVIGTLSSQKASAVQVTTKDGKVASIRLDAQTVISRDKAKVAATELKTGLFVVVDAYGDDYSDLLALEVRIVPPPK